MRALLVILLYVSAYLGGLYAGLSAETDCNSVKACTYELIEWIRNAKYNPITRGEEPCLTYQCVAE